MGKDKTMKDEKKGFDMEGTQEMPKPEEHGGGAVKGVNVRPKEEAMSLILETLQKAKAKGDELGIDVDTFGGQDAVEPVLDALYAAYEEEGTVPSREGFAERCGDKGLAEFVLDMPRDPFAKKPVRKGRVAAICAGCAAAVAVSEAELSLIRAQSAEANALTALRRAVGTELIKAELEAPDIFAQKLFDGGGDREFAKILPRVPGGDRTAQAFEARAELKAYALLSKQAEKARARRAGADAAADSRRGGLRRGGRQLLPRRGRGGRRDRNVLEPLRRRRDARKDARGQGQGEGAALPA